MIKSIIKTVVPAKWWEIFKEIRVILDWYRAGRPIPAPAFFKRKILKEYARLGKANIFIETGTNTGATVKKLNRFFDRTISIEIYPPLATAAKKRFKHNPAVTIIEGDSSEILPIILSEIKEPVLFWLDGHYSGTGTGKGISDTPIVREINAILDHPVKNHLILIDDARCFNGLGDYPKLEELHALIKQNNPNLHFKVDNDIIRIMTSNDTY